MLKQIIVFFLVFISASWAKAATYYIVKADLGEGVNIYHRQDAWPDADNKTATSPNDLEQRFSVYGGNGSTFIIAAGSYTDTELDSDSSLRPRAGDTIRAAVSTDTGYATYGGEVRLISTVATVMNGNASVDNVTWEEITFEATNASYYPIYVESGATGYVFNDCKVRNSPRGVYNRDNAIFNRVDVRGTTSTALGGIYEYNGSGTYNFPVVMDCMYGIWFDGSSTTTVNMGLVAGCERTAIKTGSLAHAAEVNGTIVIGNVTGLSARHVVDGNEGGGGSLTISDSLLQPHPTLPQTWNYQGYTDGGGNIQTIPQFSAGRYPAVFVLGIDDHGNDDHALAVSEIADSFGYHIYAAVDTGNTTSGEWDNFATMSENGHEIISHAYNHIDLTDSGALTASGRTLQEQVEDSKSLIESSIPASSNYSGATYTCSFFAPPYNATNATVEAAVKAAGYVGARGISDYLLEDVEIYSIEYIDLNSAFGTTSTKERISGFVEYLNQVGGIFIAYAHGADEFSTANWTTLFSVLAKSNVRVMTPTEAINHITNTATGFLPTGVDADGDGMRWTRTLEESDNYAITAGSDCYNAGPEAAAVGMSGSTEDGLGETRGFPGMYNLNIGIDQTKIHTPKIIGGTISGGKFLGN